MPRTRPGPSRSTVYERQPPPAGAVDAALAPSRHAVFWLEDAGEPATYPALAGSTTADLTIVGGGYCGLWTAVLAKRRDPGARVVLLEANTVGWAASGRNGGFCEASLTHGEENGRSRWPEEYDALERLGAANLDAFEADVRDLGLDVQFERTGVLSVAVEPHQVAWLRESPGYLDAAAVRREIDSPVFLAGDWSRDDCALVHPARLVRELARVAAELGVEIHEGSRVTGIDSGSAGPVTVRTARGSVTSPVRAPFTEFEDAAGAAEHQEAARGEHGVRHTIGELITCPFCLAVWVGTSYVGALAVAPRAARTWAAVFTVTAVSDFLQHGYARLRG